MTVDCAGESVWPAALLSGMRGNSSAGTEADCTGPKLSDASQRLGGGASSTRLNDSGIELVSSASSSSASDSWLAQVSPLATLSYFFCL